MTDEHGHGIVVDTERAVHALRLSGVALVTAGAAAAAMVLPPAAPAAGPQGWWWPLTLALGLLAHWVGVGIAARRLERPLLGWVALAMCLTPVGGAAALSLLGLIAAGAAGGGAGPPVGRHPAVSGA